MQIGRRIYYDINTGNVILDTGEKQGNVKHTLVEQDITTYSVLSERLRNTFNVIELEYGQYVQDFVTCNGYRVEPTTKKLEFSYPDPNAPVEEPVYQKPLSETVSENMDYLVDVDFRLSMVELGL